MNKNAIRGRGNRTYKQARIQKGNKSQNLKVVQRIYIDFSRTSVAKQYAKDLITEFIKTYGGTFKYLSMTVIELTFAKPVDKKELETNLLAKNHRGKSIFDLQYYLKEKCLKAVYKTGMDKFYW